MYVTHQQIYTSADVLHELPYKLGFHAHNLEVGKRNIQFNQSLASNFSFMTAWIHVQLNLSVTTTSIIKSITCDLFSNGF